MPAQQQDAAALQAALEAVCAERDASTAMLNSLPGVYYMYDEDGRFLRWNRRFEEVTGYSGEEIAQLHPLDLFEGADKDLLAARIANVFANGADEVEANFITRSGQRIPYYFNGVRAIVAGKTCLLGMGIDISAYKRTEQALRERDQRLLQAEKLEALGLLAGGVAHDFNNLLTVINGYGELLLEQVPADSPLRENLQQICLAGERAQALTRQLLAFGGRQAVAPEVLSLNAVIRSSENMLRRLCADNITLELALAPELWAVRVDPGQLEQILLNLVVNARDAMPGGGTLAIATTNLVLDETFCRGLADLHPGKHVLLAVTDTGTGIADEVKTRIFEPFYTTKASGKGTGLGLATVHGIVRQSLGHVAVTSESGRGTSFKVYLPAVAGLQPLRDQAGTR